MGPPAPSMELSRVGNGGSVIGPLSAEEWSMISKFALGALTSQGTMGGLLLSGLVSQMKIVHILYK